MISCVKYLKKTGNFYKLNSIFEYYRCLTLSKKTFHISSCLMANKFKSYIDEEAVAALKDLLTPSTIKKGFKSFFYQFTLLWEECKAGFLPKEMFRTYDPDHIDILCGFETQEELNRFHVTTDSSVDQGYSSASIKLTESKTCLFSGNICTTVPKDGEVKFTGFANIMTLPEKKSFYKEKHYNWTCYSHLVIKVRGDGRTYRIVIANPFGYENTLRNRFNYLLHTRGGPYWQITEIPLNHFFLSQDGRIISTQCELLKTHVTRIGITIRDGIDGPFKLEIDYIGLQKKLDNPVSCYETYKC